MVDGKDKEGQQPCHPPPPSDPFTRYQTPWPGSPGSGKDEQNPFVEFRRFADEQFQSLFSGIPKLFTAFSSNADSFQNEIQQMMQRRRDFEEGMRKQLEQDMEEQRQALGNGRHYREQPMATSETARDWRRDMATNCPALAEPLSEGAQRCPAINRNGVIPDTELELYKAFMEHQANQKEKRSSTWLPGLGWDGKQREDSPRPRRPIRSSRARSPTIFGSDFSRLNAIEDPHDTIPYLLVSPYSPVFLCNPNQSPVRHVRLHQRVNEPFRILETLYRPRAMIQWNDRREELAKQLPWADAFEDLVSLQQTGKMVERDYSTFRTPNTWIHDMVRRGSLGPTWGFNEDGQLTKLLKPTPEQRKGTVDPRLQEAFAAFCPPGNSPDDIVSASVAAVVARPASDLDMNTSTMTTSQPDPLQRLQMQSGPLDPQILKTLEWAAQDYTDSQSRSSPDFENPILLSDTQQPNSDIRTMSILVPFREPEQIHENASAAPSLESVQASGTSNTRQLSNSDTERSDSVISTTRTTERWTRPDGTIETTKVFKRMFADGREVEEETRSFEEPGKALTLEQAPWPVGPKEPISRSGSGSDSRARHTNKQTQTATPVQDELKKEKQRGGWFWNH